MSTIPASTLADSERLIADLQRQLAERTAERDEASRRLDERTAERDEAQAQQIATAEVLGVINSSPGDLAPVFDAMVERAKRLCGAANAVLFTFDGELFHLLAAAGEPQLLEQAQSFGPIPSTNAMQGRLAKGEDLVHIADVRETDVYRESPILRERVGLWGLRTWLAVALRKEDVLLGTIADTIDNSRNLFWARCANTT